MNKVHLESNFSVSPQITPEQISTLAQDGVKVIMCNRPEAEEPNQPLMADITAECEKHGIRFVHIPVSGRVIPADALQQFTTEMDSHSFKTHAFCKTGTRSSIFWALSKARTHTPEEVLGLAESAGINLTPILDQLKAVAENEN